MKTRRAKRQSASAELAPKFIEVVAASRYKIETPEDLRKQLEDAATLYDVVAAKAPVSALLEILLTGKSDIAADQREIIGELVKLARAMEQKAHEQLAVRARAAKALIVARIESLIAGTWLGGNVFYVFDLLGARFIGPERTMQIITAAENGDFSEIDGAVESILKAAAAAEAANGLISHPEAWKPRPGISARVN